VQGRTLRSSVFSTRLRSEIIGEHCAFSGDHSRSDSDDFAAVHHSGTVTVTESSTIYCKFESMWIK
jgi:hypothetical protein